MHLGSAKDNFIGEALGSPLPVYAVYGEGPGVGLFGVQSSLRVPQWPPAGPLGNPSLPEPCVLVRECKSEASAGVRIGQPLSRVRYLFRMPTPLTLRKAKQGRRGFASALRSGVVIDHWHVRKLSVLREPGVGRLRRRAGPCREGEER
jgi:hypothetical protein